MKTCTKCKVEKDYIDFRKDKRQRDGYQPRCKQCASQAIRSAYTEKYGIKSVQRTKAKAAARRSMINDIKKELGCRVCGEREPVCLEFHHLDPNVKEFTIGSNPSGSIEKLKEEISKCICVCSNCHKKIHANIIDALFV